MASLSRRVADPRGVTRGDAVPVRLAPGLAGFIALPDRVVALFARFVALLVGLVALFPGLVALLAGVIALFAGLVALAVGAVTVIMRALHSVLELKDLFRRGHSVPMVEQIAHPRGARELLTRVTPVPSTGSTGREYPRHVQAA